MKSFQVRLSDETHDVLAEMARDRKTSLADVVRDSLEVYSIASMFAREGRRLYWDDPRTGERAEVLIPGLMMRRMHTSDEASASPLREHSTR